jgi:membrane protease YdiL (CAAX protease family)
MAKKNIYILGFATLLGFPAIGFVIVQFVEGSIFDFAWPMHKAVWMQLLSGTAFGILAGFMSWRFITDHRFTSVLNKYGPLIQQFKMSVPEMIFISLCAGIGEELLFRGVLQYYWGIWPTAILFVAIHGYLNPFDTKLSAYGIFMVLLIVVIGHLTSIFGLISAMAAHTFIDIVLIYKLSKHTYSTTNDPIDDEHIE